MASALRKRAQEFRGKTQLSPRHSQRTAGCKKGDRALTTSETRKGLHWPRALHLGLTFLLPLANGDKHKG